MKKGVRYSIAIVLVAGFCIGMAALAKITQEEYSLKTCKSLDISFSDSLKFVTKNEIKNVLLQNYGNFIGQRLDSMRLHSIEQLIKKGSSVKGSQAWTTPDGVLHISVSQRTPALCFKDSGGGGFYVDDTGYIFPLDSRYTAPVLVVEGNIPVYIEPGYKGMAKLDKEQRWINDILAMTKYIGNSGEWKDSIRRIYVGDNGDIMLKMKQGDEKFILGQPEGYEAKLDKIHSYYDYIVPSVGENHYKIVNLKYNQQIVCRQKDTLQRQISVVPR